MFLNPTFYLLFSSPFFFFCKSLYFIFEKQKIHFEFSPNWKWFVWNEKRKPIRHILFSKLFDRNQWMEKYFLIIYKLASHKRKPIIRSKEKMLILLFSFCFSEAYQAINGREKKVFKTGNENGICLTLIAFPSEFDLNNEQWTMNCCRNLTLILRVANYLVYFQTKNQRFNANLFSKRRRRNLYFVLSTILNEFIFEKILICFFFPIDGTFKQFLYLYAVTQEKRNVHKICYDWNCNEIA